MKKLIKQVLGSVGLLEPIRQIRRRLFSPPGMPVHRAQAALAYARQRGMDLVWHPDNISVHRGRDVIRISPAHAVYCRDMINFFDYYFSAVIPADCAEGRVADYSVAKIHQLRLSGVQFEFPSLPESDESTGIYLQALELRLGDVVFDIGAYAGASTYFFSQAVGMNGKVVSFEPDQTNLRFLRANVARHQLTNVVIFDKGVWRETTTLAFQSEGNMGSAVVSIVGRDTNQLLVPVVTLDDAAALAGVDRVAAIKMDIEGAEVAVLQNATGFLQRHRPRLVVEPHIVNGRMNTEEVCGILHTNGYIVDIVTQGSQDWPLVIGRLPS